MLGLIVWLILIFAITIIINPSFLLVLLVTLVAFVAMAFLYCFLKDCIMRLFGKSEDIEPLDREKAIKEWETKWGKPHPSRKINRK